MGLTNKSTGFGAVEGHFTVKKESESDVVIALAGNPNVGKSTVFNELTGMNQHTGNWPGKTVASAQGAHRYRGVNYILVDLPGTYSLMAHSTEEEIARDFLLYGGANAAVVVCDATCLERNLNLVLQTMEIFPRVVVCVNLLDEAAKKGIHIDLEALSKELGAPVVGTSARSGKGLTELMAAVAGVAAAPHATPCRAVRYPAAVEEAATHLIPVLEQRFSAKLNSRWLALRLLEGDATVPAGIAQHWGVRLEDDPAVTAALADARAVLVREGITAEQLQDRVAASIVLAAEEVAMEAAPCTGCAVISDRDRKLDRILTSKATGIPIMLLLLCGVFWLTITGSNYPSELLTRLLFWVQDRLTDLFHWMNAPDWLHGVLVLGVYRVLAWVVSVMLPPMAIFFPLFTLLEDFGYLPRVAFNLDHCFKKARACGKQALTMCTAVQLYATGAGPRSALLRVIAAARLLNAKEGATAPHSASLRTGHMLRCATHVVAAARLLNAKGRLPPPFHTIPLFADLLQVVVLYVHFAHRLPGSLSLAPHASLRCTCGRCGELLNAKGRLPPRTPLRSARATCFATLRMWSLRRDY